MESAPPSVDLLFLFSAVICLLEPHKIGQVQPPKKAASTRPILTHSARTNGCVLLLFTEKAPVELCVCVCVRESVSGGHGNATYNMLVDLRGNRVTQ